MIRFQSSRIRRRSSAHHNLKCSIQSMLLGAGILMTVANQAAAAFPASPARRCANDAVVAGTVCLDRYEASVWRVPDPTTTNATLVRRIQLGLATRADLTAGGATQLGVDSDDYTPCARNGQNCTND